jgi:hypothetical protein
MREEICKARQMNETTVEIFKTQKKTCLKRWYGFGELPTK